MGQLAQYQHILEYWFGADFDEDTRVEIDSDRDKKWFYPSKAIDEEISARFAKDLAKAEKGKCLSWEDEARGRLALLIMFDRFSRCIYRGTEKVFENDLRALELSLRSVKDGFDGRVTFVERQFYYLPLMQAENSEIQQTSVEVFARLADEAARYEDPSAGYLRYVADRAKQHLEVFRMFNRLPWKNDILGRRSTSEERIFLSDPGKVFAR